jgi:hypothetical protein
VRSSCRALPVVTDYLYASSIGAFRAGLQECTARFPGWFANARKLSACVERTRYADRERH